MQCVRREVQCGKCKGRDAKTCVVWNQILLILKFNISNIMFAYLHSNLDPGLCLVYTPNNSFTTAPTSFSKALDSRTCHKNIMTQYKHGACGET